MNLPTFLEEPLRWHTATLDLNYYIFFQFQFQFISIYFSQQYRAYNLHGNEICLVHDTKKNSI